MYVFVTTHQRSAYVCALLKALATFSNAVSHLRLLESPLCRRHDQAFNPSVINFFVDSVSEKPCKATPEQTELAFLLGWDNSSQNIPGPFMVTRVLYGVLTQQSHRSKDITLCQCDEC